MFELSPWLQVPIVLAVVLPLAGVAAAVVLRVVDYIGGLISRLLAGRGRDG